MDVIVSHMNLDFDGLACLLAAKKLHPEATVALTDKQQATVKSFLAIYRDQLNFSPYDRIEWSDLNRLILVDVASIKRTGVPVEQLPQTVKAVVYDHHKSKEGDVAKGERFIERVGAAITLLTEKLTERSISISSFEATLFGLGLYTDTGNFTYPHVTVRDFHAAAKLREFGMDVALIEQFSDQVLSTEEKQLFQTLLTNGEEKSHDGLSIFVATHTQQKFQGGLASLTDKLIETTDSDAVIVIAKMKNHVHIVTRASSTRIDFRPLMEAFEGGGHAGAASALVKNADLHTVIAKMNDYIHTIIKPAITAATMMSSPVKFVSPEDKIESVLRQMFQYGHTGFPVVDDDLRLVGVISRRDADKATHHGLGHAPTKAYMSTEPITVSPDTSLEEIQATMMKYNIGRIPVTANGKMVGIISRTDVIEQLHKQTEEPMTKDQNSAIVTKMKALLPSDTFHLLQQVGMIADQKKLNVYLIGGIVRDFLLNRENEDIDLVVEGDGIVFAKELANRLGGDVVTHEAFGTATWTTTANLKVDVVTCRTEYYESPGSLPTVRASNIREDLRRRDFTINALALRINKRHFGEILDFFQGQKDINTNTIRILHTLSFIEDPTRIFRGVRFALRFGYQFDNQTKELAKSAASMLKQISPNRLFRELDLLIEEGQILNGMKLLDNLSVWKSLFNIKPSASSWEKVKKLVEAKEKDPFVFVAVLLYCEKQWNAIVSYTLTARQSKLVHSINQMDSMTLLNKRSTGQIHELLHSFLDESILLYALLTGNNELVTYVNKRKQLTVLLSGNDLIDLQMKPGPTFSSVLHKITCLQLDGHIHTKEDAINWLQNYNGNLNV
ncbi:CBS domain-containing protein [bacterium LRH843]|nr:CBS domain-containing protein [bacterium LRH843]